MAIGTRTSIRQTPEEFRDDIRRAKARIEDVIGEPVIGYRAPNFSIGRAQAWAFDILLEEGFRYDSSTYPILHDRYGQASAPRFPYEIWSNGTASLMEFPIGTAQVMGMNLPIGGGGYFRLAPLAFVRWGIARVNAREEQPVMFYLHPWEIDPGSRDRRCRGGNSSATTWASQKRGQAGSSPRRLPLRHGPRCPR